eukprot:m.19085 g.19085  ORF g.19085 m.19085 type:complete len:662 (-) comp5874_c0_seq1:180-2165(-)
MVVVVLSATRVIQQPAVSHATMAMANGAVLFVLAALAMYQITRVAATSSAPPNFVFILFDDVGWGDWSRTGAPARTPHMDAMSRSEHAVWFDRAYTAAPICSPARAGLLTGRTPSRTCIWGVEQHIMCHPGAAECPAGGEYTLANVTKDSGHNYLNAFYGKWHLGSLRDSRSVDPDGGDCYQFNATKGSRPNGNPCLPGYVSFPNGTDNTLCCKGNDGHLSVSNPLNFGFHEFVATPQCGPSGSTNCGCFFQPNQKGLRPTCDVGHYADACTTCNNHLECAAYYVGNTSSTGTVVSPLAAVSGMNDEAFLVDHFEGLLRRSVAHGRPFLASLHFHGAHIPYVATAEMRASYANVTSPLTGQPMTENEQDYWGTLTQLDAAIGRIRKLLSDTGVADNTWVSIMSDNGPEVSPANGQGTGKPFVNPGRTGGLRGRKRDLTEGGIREIGMVEFPPLISRNAHEMTFPLVSLDYLPTVLDILNTSSPHVVDGSSLVPYFKAAATISPATHDNTTAVTALQAPRHPIGWYGIFRYGSTNHLNPGQNGTGSKGCPFYSASQNVFGDVPASYSAPGGQKQVAWLDVGSGQGAFKLFGCASQSSAGDNGDNGDNGDTWHFFLYNLDTDRTESVDLWASDRDRANKLFQNMFAWQNNVLWSQRNETGCRQ